MQESLSWLHPNAVIRDSVLVPGQRGIFASSFIAEGEVIVVMGGRIVDVNTHNRIGELANNYGIDVSDEFSFCPKSKEEIDRMPQVILNHSCDPNAGFRDQLRIVAIRDISPNEEIAYDYAFILFDNPDNQFEFSINCTCKAENCRGTITVNDWKIKELQEKYGPWFQPFLREKFSP